MQPTFAERREGADRRRNPPTVPSPVPDRRSGVDRRGLQQAKVRLGDGLGRGWLAFQSDDERRRLAPIPAGWESLSESELRALWAAAQVVPKRHGRLIE